MRIKGLIVAMAGLAWLAGAAASAQSVPPLINYQGRLTDDAGQPVSDMSVPMEFSLWDASTVGTGMAQWTEAQVVEVTNGLYSVQLGAVSGLPSAPFSSANRYLQVTVYGETLAPRQRLTSVPYSMNSALLEGHPSADFALSGHGHDFTAITGEVSDAQVPDNITVNYSSDAGDAAQLGGQDPNAYVHVAGDTVTGALQVDGDLSTDQALISLGDASIFGGNLGLGVAADGFNAIKNDPATAPFYGGQLYGTIYGFRAYWATDPVHHYTTLAWQDRGINTVVGTASETGSRYGGQFLAISLDATYGAFGTAASYGTGKAYGVRGSGNSIGSAAAYGGYFEGVKGGTGPTYGIYATGSDFAAWLEGAQVHVGDTGTRDYVEGDGDLYVEDELEVDGTAYFSGGVEAPGAIDSTDVSFNYAGSPSQGGPADGLSCSDCVSATEVQFNYAGSGSEAGMATNADQLDGQHGSYYQNATNINAGTLANTYFSAYSDLGGEGYLDGNSATDVLLRSQGDTRFVNTTGDDSMAGSLTVGGDLTVSGSNIGLNIAPSANYGITNNSAGAPQYGLYMYGSSYAIRGMHTSDPASHYTYLSSIDTGIYASTGSATDTGTHYAGRFTASTLGDAYGVRSEALGYNAGTTYHAYGVSGLAYNYGGGNSYGGYFYASIAGTGLHYGVYASADDYAAWLQDGRVHVGSMGTENYVNGNGDLYVMDTLEVDGPAYFSGGFDAPNSIDSADVSFNYAGSGSKGGPASDLSCTDCVSSAEIQFNYAGSATEGGIATNADQLDGQHGSYYQDATNINGGTLGTNYYSAYYDLSAENYLDGNTGPDLVTRALGDTRFLNSDRDDATTGSLTVGGDLEVSGANFGLGTTVNTTYNITNSAASASTYGAQFFGTTAGAYGRLASDPTEHYGYLGSTSYGAYARSGASDETGNRWGGMFYGYSQANASGASGTGTGYGAGAAYGMRGIATGDSTGPAYGGYFTVAGSGSGPKYAGYFGGGRVKVGDAGTQNYVNGDGDLFVEDQLEVGGAINYSAAQTRYFAVSLTPTCPGCDATEQWSTGSDGLGCYYPDNCRGLFPVNLPDRATVTALRIWGTTDATDHMFQWTLYRKQMSPSSLYTQMAGGNVSDTNLTLVDTTITNPVIDNSNYYYYLHILEWYNSGSGITKIGGVRIDYTVDGPD